MCRLFKWFKNDWYPVWAWNGNFAITYEYGYEILYSPSRNRLKLICKGYNAELQPEYIDAVKKLNEISVDDLK